MICSPLRHTALAALSLMAALSATSAYSADRAELEIQGRKVYDRWCTACHGREPGRFGLGQTGTMALQVKYEGKVPAVLDDRTDLTPEMVAVFVRTGVNTMPFFRRTEISDADLAALGAYLSRKRAQTAPRSTAP